jgi:hypothetical protein
MEALLQSMASQRKSAVKRRYSRIEDGDGDGDDKLALESGFTPPIRARRRRGKKAVADDEGKGYGVGDTPSHTHSASPARARASSATYISSAEEDEDGDDDDDDMTTVDYLRHKFASSQALVSSQAFKSDTLDVDSGAESDGSCHLSEPPEFAELPPG